MVKRIISCALISGISLGSCLFSGSVASASQPTRSILFSVGQATQDIGGMSGELQGLGYTNLSIDSDERALAWSLGYRHPINRRWSADLQYLQQGKVEPSVQAVLPLSKTQVQAAQDAAKAMPQRGQGLSAVGVYHYPLSNSGLMLQLGAGAFIWHSERTASVGTNRYTETDNGVSPLFQLGLSYPVTSNSHIELQLQHMLMPEESVTRAMIGFAAGF